MKFKRLFSGEGFKGEKNYLNNQKKYEIARTVLFFALSAAVFLIGFITTKTKSNLLTIVAVLGCLPAAKSAVNMIMFLRYSSCEKALADRLETASGDLNVTYDRIFTSYSKNYCLDHVCVRSGSIIGYTSTKGKKGFEEADFVKHINTYLSAENYKDLTIKVFTDSEKYIDRLNSLKSIPSKGNEQGIINVLNSISL